MSADRLLVRGGRVVDGAGAEPHRADVMIVDGVIAEIGDGTDTLAFHGTHRRNADLQLLHAKRVQVTGNVEFLV